MDGRRTPRPRRLLRTLLSGLLFGALVLVAALAGAVPASAGGPDALRVTRSAAPVQPPAVAPRGAVARLATGRATTAAPAEHAQDEVVRAAGAAAPADTSPHPATDTVALLPDRRGPPSLVALAVVVPTTSVAPPGRTPATTRSRAPPTSA